MTERKRRKSRGPYLSSRSDLSIQVTLTPTQIQKNPPTGLVRHGQQVVWEVDNQLGSDTVVVIGSFLRLPTVTEGEPVADWPFKEPPPWAIAATPAGKKTKVRLHIKDKNGALSGPHRYSYSIGCPDVATDPEIVIEWPS